MKKIFLTMVLLAVVSGQVFAANKTVSINFAENTNQVFSGGQLIGPYATSSDNWNNTAYPTTGTFAVGTLTGLIDSEGDDTGIDVAWGSSGVAWNNDGTGDDEHRLAVGYLDDVSGVTITLTNIPYANYKIVGLYTSDQGDTATVNFDVNGTWALGGVKATTADAYGSITSNMSANGEYWTLIEPGVIMGNYWKVDTTGATCTITGELPKAQSRGTLAGIIIETDEEAPPVQRSISTNFLDGGWDYHSRVSYSSNPTCGFVDPDGVIPVQQIPTSTWNEGTFITNMYQAKDETGALGSAIALHSGDFTWYGGGSGYVNLDYYFAGSPVNDDPNNPSLLLEEAMNKGRVSQHFMGHNGGEPKKPLTTLKKVPYGTYTVVTYMHLNHFDSLDEIQIEDQVRFYRTQNSGGEYGGTWLNDPYVDGFKWNVARDPNNDGAAWLVASESEDATTTQRANVAIFQGLTSPDMVLYFDAHVSNSGISGYSLISEVDPEDVVTQILPGNSDKDYGDIPASVTTDLTWNAPVNGADSYDVYFGEYDDEDPNADPNPFLVESGNTTGSYTPTLTYNRGYVWKVDTVLGGETISGDYFYFDTEGDPLLQVQPSSVSVEAGTDTFFTVGALQTEDYEWWYSTDAAVDTKADDVTFGIVSHDDGGYRLDVENAEDGVNTGYYYVVLTNTIPGSATVVSEVASLEIGKLEVYLPFEGDPNDNEVFLDASGNGWNADYGNVIPDPLDPNNNTVPSMGTVSFQTGYDGVGQAVKFTRGTGDQLVIPGSDDYFNFYPKGFTIRFWVKPTYEVGGYMTYISKSSNDWNPPDSGWRMLDEAEYADQGLVASMAPEWLSAGSGRLDDGNWHLVACTYDGATQEIKVYVEGVLRGTVTGPLSATTSYPVVIGEQYSTGTGGWGYEGLIDEVEIFSYAVSEYDMLEDYAAKTGQVLCLVEKAADLDDDCKVGVSDLAIVAGEWLDSTIPGSATPEHVSRVVSWQFDETTGMTVADSSGNDIVGILGDGFPDDDTQWIIDGGRTGTPGDNALYMNGDQKTSVIATVADPGALPTGNIFLGTSSWTMNIWVKYANTTAALAMNNIGGFGQNEWLDPSTNSDRYFANYDGGYELELGQDGWFPSNAFGTGWNMLTATYDGTECAAFFNGLQVEKHGVVLVDTLVNEINLNTARRVLWSELHDTVPMNATVDDFSIWGEAFTAAQVAGMYANSFPSCDGAVGADLNGDCKANLADFALLAADWLKCDLIPGDLCD